MEFTRRKDLEEENLHILIIDIHLDVDCRMINIYRWFRPPDMISPNTFFLSQMGVIRRAFTQNCFVLGDFNLDACVDHRPYCHIKVPLAFLTDFALKEGLIRKNKKC